MHRTAFFPPNEQGRDFVVGDVHGHFELLATALDKLDFNTEIDRVFSVGDLIDRGPDSENVLHWLAKPWFHAVRGNHEQMVIDGICGCGDKPRHIRTGGAWLYELNLAIQDQLLNALQALPLIIEIDLSANKTIGIVHAQAPMIGPNNDWQGAKDAITGNSGSRSNNKPWRKPCMPGTRSNSRIGLQSQASTSFMSDIQQSLPSRASVMLSMWTLAAPSPTER